MKKLANKIWRDSFYSCFCGELKSFIFGLIDAHRDKEPVDTTLAKQFIESLLPISSGNQSEFYNEQYEVPFIENLKKYYSKSSSQFISNNTTGEYLLNAQQRIIQEEGMCKTFYFESTKHLVVKALDQVLFEEHLKSIISGFEKILKEETFEEILKIFHSNMKNFDLTFNFKGSGMAKIHKKNDNSFVRTTLPFLDFCPEEGSFL